VSHRVKEATKVYNLSSLLTDNWRCLIHRCPFRSVAKWFFNRLRQTFHAAWQSTHVLLMGRTSRHSRYGRMDGRTDGRTEGEMHVTVSRPMWPHTNTDTHIVVAPYRTRAPGVLIYFIVSAIWRILDVSIAKPSPSRYRSFLSFPKRPIGNGRW